MYDCGVRSGDSGDRVLVPAAFREVALAGL